MAKIATKEGEVRKKITTKYWVNPGSKRNQNNKTTENKIPNIAPQIPGLLHTEIICFIIILLSPILRLLHISIEILWR